MRHHTEWFADDDMTLTVPLASVLRAREEATDIVVHPDFAADVVTEELPMHAVTDYIASVAAVAPAPIESFPRIEPVPFSPAPIKARSHSEISLPAARPRFDSDTSVSTWRKTIPALRKMVGLPVVPGWSPVRMPAPPPSGPRPGSVKPSRGGWSPFLLIAAAVCLVAMVVMTIVGFGARTAEATRVAHTRVVSATGPGGVTIADGRVFVDGSAECESTPCELELTSGVHWITVRAPGYETPPSRSVRAGVEEPTDVAFLLTPSAAAPAAAPAPVAVAVAPAALIAPEPPPHAAQLPPALSLPQLPLPQPARPGPAPAPAAGAARLNLNAVPAANVVLDGRPVGRTPLMGLKVDPGGHRIVFIGPNGERAVRATVVGAGRTVTVGVKL